MRHNRRKLRYRNWHRYLWLDLRSQERFYLRQSRWLAEQRHSSTSGTPSHSRMMASAGRLLLSYARGVDQCRRMLGIG